MYYKITFGWVQQEFDDEGNCISQTFYAGDTVEYEDENGNPIEAPENEKYHPFDMVQPKT